MQVQIQAYLDNVCDVGALLEDAECRDGGMEHVDELHQHNVEVHHARTHSHARIRTRIDTNTLE